MNRLARCYQGYDTIRVLAHYETEVLIMLKDQRVRHEKINLACLDVYKITTTYQSDIPLKEITRAVFRYYDDLYPEDIMSVVDHGVFYIIKVKPTILVHYGQFTIFKNKDPRHVQSSRQ